MLGTTFYNESFRKVLVAFGTLFNNISIVRSDEVYKVPLSYGPRSKFNAILDSGGAHTPVQMTVPRLSFEWTGTTYDPMRKLSTVVRQGTVAVDSTSATYNWQRVPYNMSITLSAYVTTTEDGLKITEQILPFFTPEFALTINDVVDYDMPIILESVNQEDAWTGDYSERRYIIWSLTFSAKMYLYGPIKTSKFITDAIIQVYARNGEFDLTDIDDPSEAMANATLRAVTTPVPSGATPDTQTGTDTEVTD
tara:strand:+ start:7041 stop:7793 length:753 start_codon:yes stop_codon:yes gene_type:complete